MHTTTNAVKSPARHSRRLPAVHGTVKVLAEVGTVGPAELRQGEIAINGKPYFCRCLADCYQLYSFDARKQETTCYDLPADLSSCECLDFLSRSDRREDGRCKHQKALAALVGQGKLPRLVCNPVGC